MDSEKEKLDIEDIKDPVEKEEVLDIEEVVDETEKTESEEQEIKAEDVDSKKEEDEIKKNQEENKDILERVIEEKGVEESSEEELERSEDSKISVSEPKKSKIKLKDKRVKRSSSGSKNWVKISVSIILTMLLAAASILGGMYYFNQNKNDEPQQKEQVQEEVTDQEVVEDIEDNSVYISSSVGLNLRKEPNTKSEVLIIIPFGTKVPMFAEEEGWIKTEYDGKEGWISAEYTQKNNPWVYKNDEYGFLMTFDDGWEGYKFFEKNIDGIKILYLGLPTKDAGYIDGTVESGYASMFAISVYTPQKWSEVSSSEGPKPAVLKETDKYVFVWSQAQAMPDDLKVQFNEIKNIIATFELN